MAAQHTRSFGREAVAVYLAAALIVFGTWAASRYLILRKFENIEQNDVSRSVEVMRKALVTKNTEIEMITTEKSHHVTDFSFGAMKGTNHASRSTTWVVYIWPFSLR